MCDYKKLSYMQIGAGENIVLLHGWGANKNCWGNINSLSEDFRLTLLDLWGFGSTPEPESKCGSIEYAEGIASFIKDKFDSKVIVIAHSFGGRIALHLASWGLVSKLILIDSAGIPPRFSLKKQFLIYKYKRLKRKVALGKMDANKLDKFGSNDYLSSSKVMRGVLVSVVNENLVSVAKKIDIPTLVLWGRRDKITPLYMARTLRKTIKNSLLQVVNGGHFCFLNTSVLSFIYNFLENSQ